VRRPVENEKFQLHNEIIHCISTDVCEAHIYKHTYLKQINTRLDDTKATCGVDENWFNICKRLLWIQRPHTNETDFSVSCSNERERGGLNERKGHAHYISWRLLPISTAGDGEGLKCNWIRRVITSRALNSLWLSSPNPEACVNIGAKRSWWCADWKGKIGIDVWGNVFLYFHTRSVRCWGAPRQGKVKSFLYATLLQLLTLILRTKVKQSCSCNRVWGLNFEISKSPHFLEQWY
jgi:hypothetical protein